jgi:hypothetical protein
MAKVQLTPAQKTALEVMYRNGESEVFSKFQKLNSERAYDKLVEKDLANKAKVAAPGQHKYVLSEAGSALADVQFGSTEPDPTEPAPPASDDTATPAPPTAGEPIVREDGQLEFENGAHFQDYMGIRPASEQNLGGIWQRILEIAAEENEPPATPQSVDTGEPIADASIPFAAGMEDDSEQCWVVTYHVPEKKYTPMKLHSNGHMTQGEAETIATRWNTPQPATTKPSHGRTSRNRKNARKATQNAISPANAVEDVTTLKIANRRHSGAMKRHTVNMERKTDAAKQRLEKRNLANAVAMPTPTITGAELIARGIQVVQKP